ncbi:hypothetical protein ScalyP_jg6471 [Parmales sp. scaly parma]|nr:hypothetical protein ScalyP_jg6471 [Parmales sp. scaly parma]
MKLICLLTVLTTTTAFAVSPAQRTTSSSSSLFPTSKSKPATAPMFATTSPRQLATRGGAVPGWAAYNEKLESNPLATKAMTSLIGWALGDYLAQTFIGGGGVFNFKRFARLSAFGFLYHGPSGHYFYNWLDKQIVGTGPVAVAKKVLFDQLIWCPIFMTVFFAYLGLVTGDSLAAISAKISADLFTAVKGSWKVWPLVHTINFRFVPTKHRLLYINTVQIGFNIFLSLIGSK